MSKSTLISSRNYGVLTDASKGINKILGDTSGRTVSMRTAHGFKAATGLSNMHDDTAEDIVHGGMLLCFALFTSKNKNALGFAILAFIILVFFYQSGKERPALSFPR